MKMKKLHATSKGPPHTLIGHYSIQDGKNKDDANGWLEERDSTRDPTEKDTNSPQRKCVTEEAAEGIGDCGVLPAFLTMCKLAHMVAEVGKSKSEGRQAV